MSEQRKHDIDKIKALPRESLPYAPFICKKAPHKAELLSFLEEVKIAKDIAVNNIINSVNVRSYIDINLIGFLNA